MPKIILKLTGVFIYRNGQNINCRTTAEPVAGVPKKNLSLTKPHFAVVGVRADGLAAWQSPTTGKEVRIENK